MRDGYDDAPGGAESMTRPVDDGADDRRPAAGSERADQRWPARTGSVSIDWPEASTSETPKVAAPDRPETPARRRPSRRGRC